MDERKSAAYLKEKRIAAGWSVSELAEKVGASSYDVSCWETGFFPEAKFLLPLSEALGVSVEEILKGEDEPFSAERTLRFTQNSDSEPGKAPAENGTDEKTPPETGAESSVSASPTEHSKQLPLRQTASLPDKTGNRDKMENRGETAKSREPIKSGAAPHADNGNTVAASSDGGMYPSGKNGFSARERKFGYMICSAFILILAMIYLSGLIGYLRRDRDVTKENYNECVSIAVKSTSNFNPQVYDVIVTAQKRITNFQMTVEVTFLNLSHGTAETVGKTVRFDAAVVEKKGILTRRINLDAIMLDRGYAVISVAGDLD